jgi:hypothetical protein
MIRYALKCAEGHAFDSWFRNSAAYDVLAKDGQITCAVCGSTDVTKSIMAPAVNASDASVPDTAPAQPVTSADAPLSAPASPAEAALRQLQQHVRENSDYVGQDFATEARRIHVGEADKRAIWGEASLQDAKDLHDDGIPVAPLPWMRRRTD